jgi:hypothetical protein
MPTQSLAGLASSFAAAGLSSAAAIRQMYEADPHNFQVEAHSVLADAEEAPGFGFVLAVLLSDPEAFRSLCDPELYTREQALRIMRRGRKLDPTLETKLARLLATLVLRSESDIPLMMRIIELLEGANNPSASLPALRVAMESPDPRVRSKVALAMGRIIQNPQWAEQAGSGAEPRIAANAIESLWGMTLPAACEVFKRAAQNPHHRIASNGLVGLYLAGDTRSFAGLFRLSEHPEPSSRAAGAWAMGRAEDARFLKTVARLLEDQNSSVRKISFRAMSSITQRVNERKLAGRIPVRITRAEVRGGNHRMMAEIETLGCPLDERNLVIWSGLDLIETFSITARDVKRASYELSYWAPPSLNHSVKLQVYAASGVGEDTGTEVTVHL